MLRSALALVLCIAAIAVGFATNDEDYSSSKSDDGDFDFQNATCLEKAKRLWELFKIHHGITLNPSQDREKLAFFLKAIEAIQQHNLEADIGQHTFHVGLNEYSHLAPEEINKMKGFIPNPNRKSRNEFPASVKASSLPSSLDYRTMGMVTPVKNQGQCGSCYTFASTGALEGQLMKTTGQLISLSEQNLVDCSIVDGNEGCNGGLTDWAFQYVQNVGGIATEKGYPYTARRGRCKYSASMAAPGAKVKSVVDVQAGSEAALMQTVATYGPTTVAIDASQSGFQNYKSGVYSCTSSPNLDHAVLVIGYGTLNGQNYWLVKNSWGTSWGNQGYIYIARNASNNNANCGIANQASVPIM